MNCYVLIIEDRHCGLEVRVFASLDGAIASANEFVEDLGDRYKDYDWREDYGEWEQPEDWLFFHQWSSEGDRLRIEKQEIR